jgi:Caspase domain
VRAAGWNWIGSIFLCFSVLEPALAEPPSSEPAPERGVERLVVRDPGGRSVGWYTGSHALLIGSSAYERSWQPLESVPGELAALRAVLEAHGFVVEEVHDPKGKELRRALESFIDRYGYDPENRLLVFFSGHGFTLGPDNRAYLVPIDAPHPAEDERGFKAHALAMTQVLAWAKMIDARHVVFLFDSCFSGAIFQERSDVQPPAHIAADLMEPVRQFLTAGSAHERVPAESVFTPLVVRALRGEADRNEDGYVTGTELGLYVRELTLRQRSGQTPQFGKIRDPDLDRGDVVFALPPQASLPPVGKPPEAVRSPPTPPTSQPTRPPPTGPAWDAAPFAECESQRNDFSDGSFPLRPVGDHRQQVGEMGMTGGEFKLSMALPGNLLKACVLCYGQARRYRATAKVRSNSRTGTWGLYVLDEKERWYALELDAEGTAAIRHYGCQALTCRTELWRGTYTQRSVDLITIQVLEGWLEASVNGTHLPRQKLEGAFFDRAPVASGFLVTSTSQPPTAAFFDDWLLEACFL